MLPQVSIKINRALSRRLTKHALIVKYLEIMGYNWPEMNMLSDADTSAFMCGIRYGRDEATSPGKYGRFFEETISISGSFNTT